MKNDASLQEIRPMTCPEALVRMRDAIALSDKDQEMGHMDADDILVARLLALGEVNLVELWNKVHKWYA